MRIGMATLKGCPALIQTGTIRDLGEGPAGVFSQEGIFRVGEMFEEGAEAGVAGVAHGDEGVAVESAVFGALDRGVGKEALEVGFGQ